LLLFGCFNSSLKACLGDCRVHTCIPEEHGIACVYLKCDPRHLHLQVQRTTTHRSGDSRIEYSRLNTSTHTHLLTRAVASSPPFSSSTMSTSWHSSFMDWMSRLL
jgi:hypothetical protein